MPRLLILSQYFPPELGAAPTRLSELGERLIDRGWQVEALTALPNYPTGRVFDGYDSRRVAVEQVGRIRTVRVPLRPSQTGFRKRLICYFSFVVSASLRGPRHCARPDLLLVESPPLFIGYAARWLARRLRCRFVFNVSDLWPESAIRMGVIEPGLATWLATRLERKLYLRAAGVTGQSEEIVAAVRESAPRTPVEVITNGVDAGRFGRHLADEDARTLLGPEPGPVFVFAGLMGLAQGLDQVLDVAAALPPGTPGRFVLIGDGPVREELTERIQRERIERVRIVPAQPRDRVPALLAAADVAIISLGLAIPGAVPSKIYEAMATSLPILLVADGESARRVEEAACGLVAPPRDLGAIRACMERLAGDPHLRERLGRAGRAAAETTYDRAQIAARFDEFLRTLLPAERAMEVSASRKGVRPA
jgi:glycosyltransferase involved in cell wall biosynthesis